VCVYIGVTRHLYIGMSIYVLCWRKRTVGLNFICHGEIRGIANTVKAKVP
jgi:hypothetical protein